MCDQKTIIANGKLFIVCIPYSYIGATQNIKAYAWPAKIEVQGGYLTRFDLAGSIGYTYTEIGCGYSGDLLNFVTKNGYNYSGCFQFTKDIKGNKEYIYPDEILVENGYLKKVADASMRMGWNYFYVADTVKKKKDVKDEKDNGSSSDQIISGIDNSTLAIAGIGLYLMLA